MHISTRLMPLMLLLWPAIANAERPFEADLGLQSTLVLLPVAERDNARDTAPLLVEVSLTGTADTYLDNGARLRARLSGRVQQDHPMRPGGNGGFGTEDQAPVGGFSGLSLARPVSDPDTKARFELAYLQIDGGLGELRLGKDQGVAARFFEGAPSVLSHARLDTSLLDPTGLSVVRTRHDLTGTSTKFSYATPRLLGVRGGVSFTPDAQADGLDRTVSDTAGMLSPDLDSALELALNLSRRLPARRVRFDAALAWSRTDLTSPALAYSHKTMETLSGGGWFDLNGWRLGGSILTSGNGLKGGDYTAWRLGLGSQWQDYDWSLNYAEAEDTALSLTSEGWRLGMGRALAKSTRISLGLLSDKVKTEGLVEHTQAVVVEITLLEEFMNISGS